MIVQAETVEQIEAARTLFREYEAWLDVDLCFQSFAEELENLPGKYAAPSGRLFLIEIDGNVAGCVAVRRLDDEICEMKRLFVREQFRGSGAGRQLIEAIIEAARSIGYRKMRLDTLADKMPKAVELYQFYGFRKISAYCRNPRADALFMEKDLLATA